MENKHQKIIPALKFFIVIFKKFFSKKIFLIFASVFLLAFLLKDVNISEIFLSLKLSNKYILIFAFSLHAVGLAISAIRWKILLQSLSVNSKIFYLIKSYLVATFFNHFIPSTVGGDSVRAYDSYKLGNNKTKGLTVILVDRFLGLLTLLIFVLISTFFSLELTSQIPNLKLLLIFLSLSSVFIIWLILSPPLKLFNRIHHNSNKYISKLGSILVKVGEAFLQFSQNKKVLFKALLLSFLLQGNVILYYYLISVALDFDIHILNFSLIIPLTIFILMIPLSINGIGLRENVLFFFFSFYGITKSQAIAFAWIEFSMLLALGLIGGLVFVFRKREKKANLSVAESV